MVCGDPCKHDELRFPESTRPTGVCPRNLDLGFKAKVGLRFLGTTEPLTGSIPVTSMASQGVGFPVDSLIAAANSAMVVSFPEVVSVSEGVPPKAHLINPFAISSTKMKSRLERPSFSRGKASWSRDFHTNVSHVSPYGMRSPPPTAGSKNFPRTVDVGNRLDEGSPCVR